MNLAAILYLKSKTEGGFSSTKKHFNIISCVHMLAKENITTCRIIFLPNKSTFTDFILEVSKADAISDVYSFWFSVPQFIKLSRIHLHSMSFLAHLSCITSNYFASQRPVPSSQKPSRSSSFLGGALNRGEEGLP